MSGVRDLGETLVYLRSLGCAYQSGESLYLSVGAEEPVEETLDADKDNWEDEEDVWEVLGELADGVLGAVVPHVPGLVPRVPGTGQVGATLVILRKRMSLILTDHFRPRDKVCKREAFQQTLEWEG